MRLLGSKNATLHCSNTNTYLCQFLFVNSSNILISNLNFRFPKKLLRVNMRIISEHINLIPKNDICFENKLRYNVNGSNISYYKHCSYNRALVFYNVVNLTAEKIKFAGYNTHWAILRPSGSYQLFKLNFIEMVPLEELLNNGESTHHIVINLRKSKTSQEELRFYLQKCSFIGSYNDPQDISNVSYIGAAIHIIADTPLDEWQAYFELSASSFKSLCLLQVSSLDNLNLTINISKLSASSIFKDKKLFPNETVSKKLNSQFFGSAVRIFLTDNVYSNSPERLIVSPDTTANLKGTLVNIAGIEVSGYASIAGAGILFLLESNCSSKASVILKSNQFKENIAVNSGGVLSAIQNCNKRINLGCENRYHLKMIGNSFSKSRSIQINDINCRNFKATSLEEFAKLAESDCLSWHAWSLKSQQFCSRNGILQIIDFCCPVLYQHNIVSNNFGQGIFLSDTRMHINGSKYSKQLTNKISKNYGSISGGGLCLRGLSQLLLGTNTYLRLQENSVKIMGGGIFVSDRETFNTNHTLPCFYQFVNENGSILENAKWKDLKTQIALKKNYGMSNGRQLFAPFPINCELHTNFIEDTTLGTIDVFEKVFNFRPGNWKNKENALSFPQQICECSNESHNQLQDCNFADLLTIKEKLYPGQTLVLQLSVLTDIGINILTILEVHLFKYNKSEENAYIKSLTEYLVLKYLDKTCNTVLIPFDTFNSALDIGSNFIVMLKVPFHQYKPLNYDYKNLTSFFILHLLDDCPPGYSKIKSEKSKTSCTLNKKLQKLGVASDIGGVSFLVPPKVWIGVDNSSLLYSTYCLQVYCKHEHLNVTLKDLQHSASQKCKQGRMGVLCSKCPDGQGEVVGSVACSECSYASLLYLLIVLLLAPLLVCLICCLNLTISTRSFNGFLFYLHVVNINLDSISSEPKQLTRVLIDILNFQNPGFPLCLYPGMDKFTESLLSLILPLYLVGIVGMAFLLPKMRCINIHKVHMAVGPRITPVLATIIVLAYNKLSDFVINSLVFTNLCRTDSDECTYVWLYDGGMEYFQEPKHIVLAMLAIILMFIFLVPVTTTTIFGDLLKRCIRKQWYWNFIDTFYCSFRFKLGFWIGIRLLFVIILMVARVFLYPKESFLLTICIAHFIIIFQTVFRPFRHLRFERCLPRRLKEKYFTEEFSKFIANMNDNIFMINIAILFTCLLYKTNDIEWMVMLSESAALLQFSIILVYHTFEYSPLGPKLVQCFKHVYHSLKARLALRLKRRKRNIYVDDSPLLATTPQINLILRPLHNQSECSSELSEESEMETRGESEVETRGESEMETRGSQTMEEDDGSEGTKLSTLAMPLLKDQ